MPSAHSPLKLRQLLKHTHISGLIASFKRLAYNLNCEINLSNHRNPNLYLLPRSLIRARRKTKVRPYLFLGIKHSLRFTNTSFPLINQLTNKLNVFESTKADKKQIFPPKFVKVAIRRIKRPYKTVRRTFSVPTVAYSLLNSNTSSNFRSQTLLYSLNQLKLRRKVYRRRPLHTTLISQPSFSNNRRVQVM